MKGLISKSPHIENILAGKKTWEIRSSNTNIRGEIALIKGGSGLVVGKCNIVDVIGPISTYDLKTNLDKHCVPIEKFDQIFGGYKKIYAWVLDNALEFDNKIPYSHPKGAIIWVDLDKISSSSHLGFKTNI
jgi:hypothetical protein